MRIHRHDHRLIALRERITGSRPARLPVVCLIVAAVGLGGCGGDDGGKTTTQQIPRVTYAAVTAIPLGTQRDVVEKRLGAPSAAVTRQFAVDAHERRDCAFYPLKAAKGSPDAVRLCYDAKGRLVSTSTVYKGRQAPGQSASAGPRDNSLAKPVPGGPPPSTQPQP